VPAGSEIEITIAIDESRLVRTRAYIPVLDEEYESEVLILSKKIPDLEDLQKDLAREEKRLGEARQKAREMGAPETQQILARIDGERMVHDVETLLSAGRVDPDAAQKCQNRLLDLKSAVDQLEDALEWPALLAEANEEMADTRQVVDEHGNSGDKGILPSLERETRQAMQTRDADVLRRKVRALTDLKYRILREQPSYWVGLFNYLQDRTSNMRDPSEAEQLVSQCRKAISDDDLPALKAAVRQLIALLPADQQEQAVGYGGKTIR
jgi:molecular chaperone DnaK